MPGRVSLFSDGADVGPASPYLDAELAVWIREVDVSGATAWRLNTILADGFGQMAVTGETNELDFQPASGRG